MINPGLCARLHAQCYHRSHKMRFRRRCSSHAISCHIVRCFAQFSPMEPILNGCAADAMEEDGNGKKEEIEGRSLGKRHVLIEGSFVVEDLDVKLDGELFSDPVVGKCDGRIPSYTRHHLRQLFCLVDDPLPG